MNQIKTFKSNHKINQTVLVGWFWSKYVRTSIWTLILALVFMSVEGSMMGLLSYAVKALFDNVFLSGNEEQVWFVAVAIFLIFSVRALSGLLQRLLVAYVGQGISKTLQKDLVSHMLTLDIQYFHRNAPGLLIERVRVDSQRIIDNLANIIMTLGRDGVALISLLLVAFIIDWRWALIAFLGAPILIIPILFLQNWIRSAATKSRDAEADISTSLDEIFHGIKAIKLNNIEKYEMGRLEKILEFTRNVKFKMESGIAGMPAMIDIIAALGFFGVMIFGGREIIQGDKSVGEFMGFFTAMALIFEPLRRLSNISGSFQVALASISRLHLIFQESPKIKSPKDPIRVKSLKKPFNVKFDGVYFSYDNKNIISNLSFNAMEGNLTAIVGSSGSGKTTILNLISRLIEPSQGSIGIGSVNISDFELKELRSLVSVVSQESSLFDDTIRNNILVGRLKATEREIKAAVKDSLVIEFLEGLPRGLETLVGPRGANLSGGQRQRVLIARALLRNSPVLLLDEPTSALDYKSEAAVQKGLVALSKGRTTILIAHRISTVMNADNIIVLKNGSLVEEGKHHELLKKGGVYADLAKIKSAKIKNIN